MPIQLDHYSHHGGGNYVVIVCCPNVVAPGRLVHFDHNRRSGHWVIRDFITGRRLDNFGSDSELTVADIEIDAVCSEFPPWCPVERQPEAWTSYLRLRTTAHLKRRANIPEPPPNPQWGTWEAFLGQ